VRDVSPESPESRRAHPDAHPHRSGLLSHIGPGSRLFEFLRRTVVGVYNDGFIHAGNLAYLTLLAMFPFFIILAAAAQLLGRPEENLAAVHSIVRAFPPSVGAMIEATAAQVLSLRTGPLLWFGAAIGVWTVGSFIETIREILRRAYGTEYDRPFWQYRLIGVAIIVVAVGMLIAAFSIQIILTTAEEVIMRFVPAAGPLTDRIGSTRFVPILMTFFSGYLLFWSLAPRQYRGRGYPKWPGALFVTLWWYVALLLLPKALGLFGGYTLTYGGLAGVMVAMLFFWLVGYGLVIAAHINAALANPGNHPLKDHRMLDELVEAKWLDT
jgi:membrane protein